MSKGTVRVSVRGRTDLGRTRDHNEDTFLVADLSTRRSDPTLVEVVEHEVGPRGSLFMVADGMGGAAAGEVASAMASAAIYEHLTTAWPEDADGSGTRFAYRLREAVEIANGRIHQYSLDHPDVRGMGTTTTAVVVLGPDLYLAQIGDSRAYLLRAGETRQLTKDQSLMQRLVDAGELTEEEAEQSERRNIILQALGPDPRVKVDLTHQGLCRGDVLVICSDGLSGVVKRDELGATVAQHLPDLDAACGALIDLANARGGPDNVTVVIARFDGEALPEPADATEEVGHHVFAVDEDDIPTAEHPVVSSGPEAAGGRDGTPDALAAVAGPAVEVGSPVFKAGVFFAAAVILGLAALLLLR
ncbi:MAG: protein phosphatase 2C domain-containing protein [Gemmatimonadales bacterium]|nr:protein phosphatase 2C domain-containing protein [Gemmatimonadales bacterium]